MSPDQARELSEFNQEVNKVKSQGSIVDNNEIKDITDGSCMTQKDNKR